MKALFCAKCSSIQSAPAAGGWRSCLCGQSAVRWVDPYAGQLEVWAVDLELIRVIGLHNGVIAAAYEGVRGIRPQDDERWRALHREVCDAADGYLFHADRRGCWAVVTARNESGDVRWTTQRPWPGVGDYEPTKEPAMDGD